MFSAVDDFEPQDGRPRRPNQDALLAQLGGPQTAMPQAPQPPAPNVAGIAGRNAASMIGGSDQFRSAVGDAVTSQLQPRAAGAGTAMSLSPADAAAKAASKGLAAPAEAPKGFQSDNQSVSGYLIEAMNAMRPDVIKHGDEGMRKSLVEARLRELQPEIEKRAGRKVSNIKNEKLQYEGDQNWYDVVRDVSGEFAGAYQDLGSGDGGGQGPMPMMGAPLGGLDPSLSGDPMAAIQAAIAQYANNPNQKALLEQLGQ